MEILKMNNFFITGMIVGFNDVSDKMTTFGISTKDGIINVTALGKTAELIRSYFSKKDYISVSGKIKRVKKDNNYYYNFIVNEFGFCKTKN